MAKFSNVLYVGAVLVVFATFLAPIQVDAYGDSGCCDAYSSTYTPSYNSSYTPSYSSSYTPSYSSSYTPSYSSSYTPSYSSSYTPSYSSSYTPSYSSSYTPSYSSSYTPSYSSSYTPSYSSSYTPSYNSSYTPSYSSSYTPSYNSSYTPSYSSSYTPTYSYTTPNHSTSKPVVVSRPVIVTHPASPSYTNVNTSYSYTDNSINDSYNITDSYNDNSTTYNISDSYNTNVIDSGNTNIAVITPIVTSQYPVYVPPVYTPPVTYTYPQVALSQIPYTGVDLGPVGMTLYFSAILAFALAAGYLAVYYMPAMFGVRKAYATPIKMDASSIRTPVRENPIARAIGDSMAFMPSLDGSAPHITISRV